MDKGFMIFIVIGIGFLYFVTTFIGDIQAEDEAYRNNDYNDERKYDQYKATDSMGQDILNVSDANAETQLEVWNKSPLKEEFLELFPDFYEMKYFINNRIRGETFKDKLSSQVKTIENNFFSGSITVDDAKYELSTLK